MCTESHPSHREGFTVKFTTSVHQHTGKGALTTMLSGTWYFSNFFLLVFMTFRLFYLLHILFSQFHSSRKDKTCAIDPMT